MKEYCRCCKQETDFVFKQEQTYHGKRVFDLYICAVCRDARAFNRSAEWEEHMADLERKRKSN